MLELGKSDKEALKRVGEEPPKNSKRARSQNKETENFKNWLMALFLSFIPLFSVPIYKDYIGKTTNFYNDIMSVPGVFFITVSLALSVQNDSTLRTSFIQSDGFKRFFQLFVIICVILYTIFSVASIDAKTVNSEIVITLNSIFFFCVLILGLIAYLRAR